jgi:hypothetical protein
MLVLLAEHLDRRPTGSSGVDLGHERLTCPLERREVLVLIPQVVIVGTRSALAIFTVFSEPPFDWG